MGRNALILAAVLAATPMQLQAKNLVVCEKVSLPGKEHSLNPNAPKDKQVQEKVNVCETVTVPDPPVWENEINPITDFKHDPRAFT